MNQQTRLLSLGTTMRKYIDVIAHTEQNVINLGKPENMQKYQPSNTTELNNRYIKQDIRQAFKEFLEFNEPEYKALPVFFASACFTLDWDNLLESIKDLSVDSVTNEIQVASWGHIYPNIDVNFVKQLRNAFAHSKFDYDFDNDRIYINAYKNTFQVQFPSHILLSTPKTLWALNKSSTSKSAWIDCAFTTGNPGDNNLYLFFLHNGDTAHESVLRRFSSYDISKVPLVERVSILNEYATKLMDQHFKSGEELAKNLKRMASQCGLELEYKGKFDKKKETFKGNKFLEKMADIVYHEDDKGLSELFLRGAIMRPEKSFMSNPFYHTIVTCAFQDLDNSIAKNVSTLTKNHAPYFLNNIREYAERAYLNYVFNYLWVKVGLDKDFCESQSMCENLTNKELIEHLRNSIVHPNRLVKEGDNYNITDYNRKHELTFSSTIPCTKLVDFADIVIEQMKQQNIQSNVQEQ